VEKAQLIGADARRRAYVYEPVDVIAVVVREHDL
jgi:hypothetical protein